MPAFLRDRPLLTRLLAALLAGVPIGLWVDRPVEQAFHGVFGPVIERLLWLVTDLGLAGWWFALAIAGWLSSQAMMWLLGAQPRIWQVNARAFYYMLSSLIVGGALVQALKFTFGRYRPKQWFNDGLYGLAPFSGHDSFPSGHSQAIFTAMTALAVIHPAGRRCYLALGFAVALSRVLLGQHYLADIVAGGVLGSVSALWVKAWFERGGKPTPALICPKGDPQTP